MIVNTQVLYPGNITEECRRKITDRKKRASAAAPVSTRTFIFETRRHSDIKEETFKRFAL